MLLRHSDLQKNFSLRLNASAIAPTLSECRYHLYILLRVRKDSNGTAGRVWNSSNCPVLIVLTVQLTMGRNFRQAFVGRIGGRNFGQFFVGRIGVCWL